MTGYIAGGTFNRPVMSKTANGGRNWQAVENLPVTSRFAAMTPHPNGGVGAISRGGGDDSRAALIFSRNWREWRSLLSMEEFFSALSFDGVDFWVGGKNGLLLKTADGVSIEEPGRRVTTEDLLDVDFADDRQGWAVGTGATVLISSNGGKDWRIPEHFPGWDPVGVAAITSERVIVHCRSAVELASDDGGESWEEIEISRSVVTKITRRGGALLASTEAGVAYSDDAGRSWTDLNWGVAPSDVAIADESRFYAAFQNGAAKVSRDGGENWEETDAVPRNCSRIFQFDANHGWANCVTDSGAFLWVTRDGWENRIATPGYEQVHDWAFITPRKGWISYQSGGDNFVRTVNAGFTDESDAYGGGKITAIASLDSTRLWICGYGGFIARLILDEQGTPVVTPLPVSTSLLLAYPNPSNGWVNVLWGGRPQGIGGVSLYDSGGRSLRTFVVGPDGAFSFDAGGLPSGSYLLRVTGESSGSLMIRIAK